MTGLSEVIDTLQELKRMHQLNMELLEQFSVTCGYLLKSGVQIPNARTFASLLNKAMFLLEEIKADEPTIIQYTNSRRKVTPFKTDEEVPEPRTLSRVPRGHNRHGKKNSRHVPNND